MYANVTKHLLCDVLNLYKKNSFEKKKTFERRE